MSQKPRLVGSLLVIIILLIFFSACKTEPVETTPTKIEPIVANGSILHEDRSIISNLEIVFYPDGGVLKGTGTIDINGALWIVTVTGRSYASGEASGQLTYKFEDAFFKWDWKGQFSDGIFEGEGYFGEGAERFILTY